jgi:DNA primase
MGTWRVTAVTHLLIVVEGLFDMLAFAEVLTRRRLLGEIVPVATVGATPSADVITWLAEFPGALVLVPDPDAAGEEWADRIAGMRNSAPFVATPPNRLDPDEAVHAGWFPFPI